MKDTSSRLSEFGTALMNCTIALLFCIFLISYLTPFKEISSDLKVTWISPGRGFRVARLIPNIDLEPQFTFNIKQIFLYVVAKTKGKEEMVWSKIVQNGDSYKFFDLVQTNYIFESSSDQKIEFEIRGSVFPYTGQLLDVHYGRTFY